MKSLLFCAFLVTVQCAAFAQLPRPLPRRSNIILIVADGLGIGDLSCYGQAKFQTPNLDKLAAGGIRFTRYSAGSASSSLACAALMLGRKEPGNLALSSGEPTIAKLLKDSGYFTCMIGEWDLGGENSSGAPWLQGFDDFSGYFGHADAANVYADYVWRYDPDPMHEGQPKFAGPEEIYNNTGGKKGEYIPDLLASASRNVIKNHRPTPFNAYRALFLVLNCAIPGNDNLAVPSDAPFSEESWPQPEKNRAAMIARLDGYVGEMLEELEKIGQASNTVIFLTSDTAPKKNNGTDPKFFHENLSPDSLVVPLIVSWPGKIPAGRVSNLECSACDFLPTAADIAFITPPADIEGKSFLPTLLGTKKR